MQVRCSASISKRNGMTTPWKLPKPAFRLSREIETQPFRDSRSSKKTCPTIETSHSSFVPFTAMEFKYQTVKSKRNKRNGNRKKNVVKDISEWTVQDVIQLLDRRR
jgi:hypothetical protein